MSVPEMALLWKRESCAEGVCVCVGGGTRLGACSDHTLPPSTHTQTNSADTPL